MVLHRCIGFCNKMMWLPGEVRICQDCYPELYADLKSENDRLTRQYEEAMTVLGFYADEDEHKSRNVDLDYGERARTLIAQHEAEKEKMKK